ncbi:MAG: phospholipid carrier-dependent glycosyltransferase [Anaerolineales bacterium]|nr:phospholipid carrier-dependent glycosyltransferase [Anaerolineales bacterium]
MVEEESINEDIIQYKYDYRGTLKRWSPFGLLLLILFVGGYLRFIGPNWDENSHPHPDERFLTMVETSLRIPASLGEYFNTSESPLNPNNTGHTFFVYGTLPIFIVRFLAEVFTKTGYDQVHLVGRAASATFDLISVFLVYLIAARLYRKRVALLAAALTAFSVLLIQHAHFFVVDPFANTFILLGIYFAIRVMDNGRIIDYVVFGLALGMSVASKVSAAPLAFVVAVCAGIRLWEAEEEDRLTELVKAAIGLTIAAVISLITFRVFQPYAFQGPTFFGIAINENWLNNMKEIAHQQSGAADFPPALQWALRTPIFFALQNLVLWGVGLPLGIVAWLSWGWATYRMIRYREIRHAPLVIWILIYFLWQSTNFTPAMRYQLPVYPTLAIMAAWGLWQAWDVVSNWTKENRQKIGRAVVGGVGALVLVGTGAYAFAFVNIYKVPHSQVAASRWIYANIPAGINLVMAEGEGEFLEPGSVPTRIYLDAGISQEVPFRLNQSGNLNRVILRVTSGVPVDADVQKIDLYVYEAERELDLVGSTSFMGQPVDGEINFQFNPVEPVELIRGRDYVLRIEAIQSSKIELLQEAQLNITGAGGDFSERVRFPQRFNLLKDDSYRTQLTVRDEGEVIGVHIPYLSVLDIDPSTVELEVHFVDSPNADDPIQVLSYKNPSPGDDEFDVKLYLDEAIPVGEGQTVYLRILLKNGLGISMRGSIIINETTWDLGLPMRIDGRDGFGGMYTGLNMELYWPDDQDDDQDGVSDKLERIVQSLSDGDYIVIPTNRVYGTTTRVPIRYPLTTEYYRALFDCHEPRSVLGCAARAEPGSFQNDIGYELIAINESNPTLGPFEISDQSAEEAFTVYDHPKVLIFAKTDEFSEDVIRERLLGVDVSNVLNAPPKDLTSGPSDVNILLPEDRLEEQTEGGTWSELFNRDGLINRSGFVATLVWWLAIALLGIAAFPLTRFAFKGFRDGGYPLARIIGLLFLSWGSWVLASLQIPFTNLLILFVFIILLLISAMLVWRNWEDYKAFFIEHKRTILWTEVLALGLFILDLAIRLGNPDLWHPYKGGEKPMDFSYLNAVLKSTSFPPYDPWFAGGFINYYYYGFVLVGVPIKFLGIVPSVAYNLVIPTLFALLGLAAFSVGYNLVARIEKSEKKSLFSYAHLAGLLAAVAIVLFGNLGTARMIYDGFKQLGGWPGDEAPFGSGLIYSGKGFIQYVTSDVEFPVRMDSWYWDPSRAIEPGPGEAGPITEFPFFTFLYADLHAHMINLPLTVTALAWGLSWLLAADKKKPYSIAEGALALFVGALVLGALRPTNMWDFPTYWALCAVAVIAAAWYRREDFSIRFFLEAINVPIILFGLAYLLYQPFNSWYQLGYTAVDMWQGSKTGIADYLTVHGVFLFVILIWMVWELRQWMASTPLSSLNKLRPYLILLLVALFVVTLGTIMFTVIGYQITPIAFHVMIWAGILILRPKLPIEKRAVLFLIGTATVLTLVVEFIVLRGDISRMNTVFKFYLEVWTLFSISASAAFVWILIDLQDFKVGWRIVWQVVAGVLLFLALLYPLTATSAKIKDRMSQTAPHVLDGAAFMETSTYHDIAGPMDLNEDYAAIRWMQDNVKGTPVIVEGNTPEYRWGSRYTIYTGLPGVLGWNWHQRQQRGFIGDSSVMDRAHEISSFYTTQLEDEAKEFLETYNVKYIVVGRLEKQYYEFIKPCWPTEDGAGVNCDLRGYPLGLGIPDVHPSDCQPINPDSEESQLKCPTYGLLKFEVMEKAGILEEVYRIGETVIYEVIL